MEHFLYTIVSGVGRAAEKVSSPIIARIHVYGNVLDLL